MSDIQVFQHQQFGLVRTVERCEEPWFLATDICNALGLKNTTEALRTLDPDERSTEKIKVGTRLQDINVISESGMYALIMRSNKQEARAFRKWVTSVVLPQIRKTGSYSELSTDALVEKTVNNPDWVIEILTKFKEEKQKRVDAERQRDEAIKKKMCIGNKREATVLGKLGQKTIECNKLREENKSLKSRLGIDYEEYDGEEFLLIKNIKWVERLFGDNTLCVSHILSNRLKRITDRLGLKTRKDDFGRVYYPVAAIKELYSQIESGAVSSLNKYKLANNVEA